MTKAEITLELVKLVAPRVFDRVHASGSTAHDYTTALAEAYNTIYDNLKISDK